MNWPGWTPSATSLNFATVMLTAHAPSRGWPADAGYRSASGLTPAEVHDRRVSGRVDAGVDHGGTGPGQRVRQRRGQFPLAGDRGGRRAHGGRGGRERDRAVPDRLVAAVPGRLLL